MSERTHRRSDLTGAASALAANVVPLVNRRLPPRVSPEVIAAVLRAVRHPDPAAVDELIVAMRGGGVPPAAMVEHAIPAAARLLGEEWCSDQASFAAVTIGCARLQAVLRACVPEPDAAPAREGAMIVLRRGRQHALGAAVAAAQLRLSGIAAFLCAGRPDVEVADIARSGGHAFLALSLPAGSDFEAEAAFIRTLRRAAPRLPIVVGGGAIAGAEETSRIALGADHATTDIREAARRCGLTVTPYASSTGTLG